MANGKWCDVIHVGNRHAVSYDIMKQWYMLLCSGMVLDSLFAIFVHCGQPFWNWLSLFRILYENQLFSLYSVLFLNYCSLVPCMLIVLLAPPGTATRVYRYIYNYETYCSFTSNLPQSSSSLCTFTLYIPLSTRMSSRPCLSPSHHCTWLRLRTENVTHKCTRYTSSDSEPCIYVILHCICTYAYPL